jgi:ectoine hydroxylase-related dioxygenase (phytanoyl-CoA dioxygenase family)
MNGNTFHASQSSKNNTMRVGLKETQFGYFANSGVRVVILRGEALFFLDFLWLLSLIKQRK